MIYLSLQSIWIMDFGWWMLSFKVKFEDFKILFRYSKQVFGNWLLPVTIWLFGSGYTLNIRVWGVKWLSRPWNGSWGVTSTIWKSCLLHALHGASRRGIWHGITSMPSYMGQVLYFNSIKIMYSNRLNRKLKICK